MAKFLKTKTKVNPRIGIICGSGLGGLVENLDSDKTKDVIPYEKIPGFPKTTGQEIFSIKFEFLLCKGVSADYGNGPITIGFHQRKCYYLTVLVCFITSVHN